MRITILTIFPELFQGFLESSLVKKAQDKELLNISLVNIRDFADPPHFAVDDLPYGGGAGMVMMPGPLLKAIQHAKRESPGGLVVLLTPAGKVFSQAIAADFSRHDLILVCGRYEGIDQRVIELAIDREISIGDFILMGGEVPAMAVIEATIRLLPKVIGNPESLIHESFHQSKGSKRLEAPQYTRPPEFEGRTVPEVLLSGNHKKIEAWRDTQSHALTMARRPELLKN